jgi:hypothetical protein
LFDGGDTTIGTVNSRLHPYLSKQTDDSHDRNQLKLLTLSVEGQTPMNRKMWPLFALAISSVSAPLAHAQFESAQFGLVAPINGRYELIDERKRIPWEKGVCEPWLGVYLKLPAGRERSVEFRAFRQDGKTGAYRLVQEDPAWVVVEGAILTGDEIEYEPGKYRFTVSLDSGVPLTFDFEIVPFSEIAGGPCPGPTYSEAREQIKAQRGA